jgi:O-antigen ligase
VPRPLWFFAPFFYWFVTTVVLHDPIAKMETAQYFVLLLQAVIMFWACANLLLDERVARRALWAMVAGSLVWSVLPLIGLGRTDAVVWTGGARVTAFGQNANRAALLISLGTLALFALTQGRLGIQGRARFLAWPVLALMAYAALDTGSRGGLLSLTAALLVFIFFNRARTVGRRLRIIAVGILTIVALVTAAFQTEVMRHRLEDTAETGTMAGREELFPALWGMFLERPLTGWGPVNSHFELAIRAPGLGKVKRDSHNIVLELLTATGAIGAIPFLFGLFLCGLAAWRARRGVHGVLPLAFCAMFAVANMSGNHIAFKPFWFTLAFACAAAPAALPPTRRSP